MSTPPGGGVRERAAIAIAVGALTFVLIMMTSKNGPALGAAFVVTILTWLLVAPRDKKQEDKNK